MTDQISNPPPAGSRTPAPPATLSHMLTEQALDGAVKSARGDATESPPAAAARPSPLPEVGGPYPRESAELRNQLLQLRSDVALQGARLRRLTIDLGLLSLVVIAGATLWLDARQTGLEDARRVEAKPPPIASRPTERAAAPAPAPVAADTTSKQALPEDKLGDKEKSAPSAQPAEVDCETLVGSGEGGERVDFSILFGVGSAQLPAGAEGTLNGFAQMLKMLPPGCVLVEGYADASGRSTRNEEVSMARARTVAAALVESGGIEQRRLVVRGLGSIGLTEGAPVRDPANRRVVFRLFRH